METDAQQNAKQAIKSSVYIYLSQTTLFGQQRKAAVSSTLYPISSR